MAVFRDRQDEKNEHDCIPAFPMGFDWRLPEAQPQSRKVQSSNPVTRAEIEDIREESRAIAI